MTARNATAVDQHVGRRIRMRRRELGVTQAELGRRVGRGEKQIRKLEHGRNRVGAGTLYCLARALEVSPGYFFEGNPPAGPPPCARADRVDAEAGPLVRQFYAIPTPARRRAFLRLVKGIAGSAAAQDSLAAAEGQEEPS